MSDQIMDRKDSAFFPLCGMEDGFYLLGNTMFPLTFTQRKMAVEDKFNNDRPYLKWS